MKNFYHILFDNVRCYESLISTQEKADDLIRAKSLLGNFLLVAKQQTLGKGRKKNLWWSPQGGLWMTAALYNLDITRNLSIFTGISLHRSLLNLHPDLAENLRLKWPNDIYYRNKKICGILSSYLENHKYHLLGIGINTNILSITKELENQVTSLQIILKKKIDHRLLLKTFWDIFSTQLPEFIEKGLDINYFEKYSYLFGKKIEFNTDFQKYIGVVHGINVGGALILKLESGLIQPFYAGSISILPH